MNTFGIEMGHMMFPNERHSEVFQTAGDTQETKADMRHYSGDFMVIACVSYRNTLTNEFHRTAEIYYLDRKKAGQPINLKGDMVPLDSLVLQQESIHRSHVD